MDYSDNGRSVIISKNLNNGSEAAQLCHNPEQIARHVRIISQRFAPGISKIIKIVRVPNHLTDREALQWAHDHFEEGEDVAAV